MLDRLPEDILLLIFHQVADAAGVPNEETAFLDWPLGHTNHGCWALTRVCKHARAMGKLVAYRGIDLNFNNFKSTASGAKKMDTLLETMENGAGCHVRTVILYLPSCSEDDASDLQKFARVLSSFKNTTGMVLGIASVLSCAYPTQVSHAIAEMSLKWLIYNDCTVTTSNDQDCCRFAADLLTSQGQSLEFYSQVGIGSSSLSPSFAEPTPHFAQLRHLEIDLSHGIKSPTQLDIDRGLHLLRRITPRLNFQKIHTLVLKDYPTAETVVAALADTAPFLTCLKLECSYGFSEEFGQNSIFARCVRLKTLDVICGEIRISHLQDLASIELLRLRDMDKLDSVSFVELLKGPRLPRLRKLDLHWYTGSFAKYDELLITRGPLCEVCETRGIDLKYEEDYAVSCEPSLTSTSLACAVVLNNR